MKLDRLINYRSHDLIKEFNKESALTTRDLLNKKIENMLENIKMKNEPKSKTKILIQNNLSKIKNLLEKADDTIKDENQLLALNDQLEKLMQQLEKK